MCHKHSSRIGVFSYWVQENILIYIEEKKQNRYMQCMGIEDFLHINLVQNLHRVSLEGLINPPHLSLQYPAFPLETMSNISNSKRSISIQGDPSNTEFLLFHVLRCFNVKALHYFWKHFMQLLFTLNFVRLHLDFVSSTSSTDRLLAKTRRSENIQFGRVCGSEIKGNVKCAEGVWNG